MKPKNFPRRKQQRRIEAQERQESPDLEARKLREEQYPGRK